MTRSARCTLSCLSALLLSLASLPARGQQTGQLPLSRYTTLLGRFGRAAEKQGRQDWPDVVEPVPLKVAGTRVMISFAPRSADILLVAPVAYGRAAVEGDARRLATAMGLRNARFLTAPGERTVGIDIDISRDLDIHYPSTAASLDLAAMQSVLVASRIPRPVVVGVDTRSASEAVLTIGAGPRTLKDFWFSPLKELPAGARLTLRASPVWYAFPVALLFIGFWLFSAALPWWATRKIGQVPAAPQAQQLSQEDIQKRLDAVQKRYDKRRPAWLSQIGWTIPFLLIISGDSKRLFSSIDMVLGFSFLWVILGGFLLQAASWSACRSYTRARRRRSETPDANVDVIGSVFRAQLLPMALILLPGIVLIASLRIPVYTHTALMWRARIGLGAMVATIPCILLGMYLMKRAGRKRLVSGPWYDLAMEMAMVAGVRVRRVLLIESPMPNAFASAFGTVGMTQGLLDNLPREEIRAVLAHEMGHLKRGHTWRKLAVYVLYNVLVYGTWIGAGILLGDKAHEGIWGYLNHLLVYMLVGNVLIALLFGPGDRKREQEADRLAVTWIGDAELMMRSLMHIHALAANPMQLKRSDEALSWHPSLAHRLEAIRRDAGLPPAA